MQRSTDKNYKMVKLCNKYNKINKNEKHGQAKTELEQ